MKPSNPLEVNESFGGTRRRSSSETSVDFQRTTWRYIPEYSAPENTFLDKFYAV
jgi:hypothetical protein